MKQINTTWNKLCIKNQEQKNTNEKYSLHGIYWIVFMGHGKRYESKANSCISHENKKLKKMQCFHAFESSTLCEFFMFHKSSNMRARENDTKKQPFIFSCIFDRKYSKIPTKNMN